MNKNKKNSGFTLIELLIVLVVGGLIIAAAMALYTKNQNTTNARTIAQDYQSLSSGIKSSFGNDEAGFKSLTSATVCQLGLLNSNFSYNKDCTGEIKNKYSGTVTITPAADDGTKANAFSIEEDKVPSEVINKVITQLGTEGTLGISVNGTCVYSAGVTGSEAATGCSNTAASGFNAATLATALSSTNNGKFVIAYGM